MSPREYYALAKPGMVYGNLIPVIGGFALASRGDVRLGLFAATVVGAVLGMASACVFNNVIDHDVDAKMRRTKHRAVAAGRISRRAAFAYGTALGLAGLAVYARYVNAAAIAVAAFGSFFYLVMYSMWWKRRSTWGTVVGSVSGAIPPVVGYVAVNGRIDAAAAIIFATMVAWQMPHFFAIAIRHADDYAAAGIPVLPVVRGLRAAKVQMALYAAAFVLVAPLLSVFGYSGSAYFAVVLLLGLAWLALCLRGFLIPDADKANLAWARDMFLSSLVLIVALFAAMTFSTVA